MVELLGAGCKKKQDGTGQDDGVKKKMLGWRGVMESFPFALEALSFLDFTLLNRKHTFFFLRKIAFRDII